MNEPVPPPTPTVPPPPADDLRPSILVIDDEEMVRRAITRTLVAQGFRVLGAPDGASGLEMLATEDVDVALIDMRLPDMSGLDVLKRVPEVSATTECIVFTGHADVSVAFSVLNSGASDYFEKPIRDWPRFYQVLRRSAEVRRLKVERNELASERQRVGSLIGNSAAMETVRDLIRKVADSTASILITGESGVGKELVAEAIHKESKRRGRFVSINCAAVPRELLEGELFGWEKGAHSAALKSKEGLFAIADDGTVLLDEIGDLPYDLQAKLLRVLESRQYRPLGATDERPFTARVLAATHKDLEKAVADQQFRQDLLFRINVLTIHVPPLRERPEDVVLLTYHFVHQINTREGRTVKRIAPEVLQRLEAWPWPGNVRELRNAVFRAVLLSPGEDLLAEGLPAPMLAGPAPTAPSVAGEVVSNPYQDLVDKPYADAKEEVVRRFSKVYVEQALAASGGSVKDAAAAAGMAPPNFSRLMKRFSVARTDGEADPATADTEDG